MGYTRRVRRTYVAGNTNEADPSNSYFADTSQRARVDVLSLLLCHTSPLDARRLFPYALSPMERVRLQTRFAHTADAIVAVQVCVCRFVRGPGRGLVRLRARLSARRHAMR